jgi:hypothetical protein
MQFLDVDVLAIRVCLRVQCDEFYDSMLLVTDKDLLFHLSATELNRRPSDLSLKIR